MDNFVSSVGDSSVATARTVENPGPLQLEALQSSVQDKKPTTKEPQSGYLDMASGEVLPKKDLSEPAQRLTPEDYKRMAEEKQAIARQMEQHEFTPEEIRNQKLKEQQIEALKEKGIVGGIATIGQTAQEQMKEAGKGEKQSGEKHTKVSSADGGTQPVDAPPVQGKKPFEPDTKGDGKSTKEQKEPTKEEQTDKKLTAAQLEKLEAMKKAGPQKPEPELTDAQWEKLRAMKEANEARYAQGQKGEPVDASGNGKKPVPTGAEKPEVKPGSTDHIDPGHNKPNPYKPGPGNEKPPVPKESEG